MSNIGRNVAFNGAFGFLIGYVTRLGFDTHNKKIILKRYRETRQLPKKKSLGLAFILALAFGSLGLLYITPRTAISIGMFELPLAPLLLFSIVLRPITLFIALIGTISYNKMVTELIDTNSSYHYDRYTRRPWE